MQKSAREFDYDTILQYSIAKLPWEIVISVMYNVKSTEERLWYAEKAVFKKNPQLYIN